MKLCIDNKLIRKLEQSSETEWKSFIDDSIQRGDLPKDTSRYIIFGWPNLLAYLDLGSLFENFFTFDEHNPLFAYILSSLACWTEEEELFRLYDQVFVECLTHVKALPQIDPRFLVDEIQKREALPWFSQTLDQYKNMLMTNPSNAMHDLILYLGWDRVCVNLAMVFEYPSTDLTTLEGLKVLRECLLESFQHITGQGRTLPGFFRLLEALYAFEMRQENLETHNKEEWEILCLGGSVLKPRNAIADVLYIDKAIGPTKEALTVFTMDTSDNVKATESLAQCILKKLVSEQNNWNFILNPVKILCVKEETLN